MLTFTALVAVIVAAGAAIALLFRRMSSRKGP